MYKTTRRLLLSFKKRLNSMKKKIYTISNHVERLYRHYIKREGKGLLHFKEDPRDKQFIGTGEQRGLVDYGFRFHQFDNICVFASRELGRSQQDGVEWSVTFMVKLAVKLGMTSGNGYSYLRAANEIATKYGRIPAVLHPNDHVRGQWRSWTKWTERDEQLLKVAAKYKIKPHGGYSRVTTNAQARQAITEGHSIFTAVDWYSAMNRPKAPSFWLEWAGSYIGGHAIQYDQHDSVRFYNLQTFGELWGDKGYAYTRNIIGNIIGGAYVEAHYPTELLAQMVSEHYEGLIIRDIKAPECYIINNGKKRHITTMEEYITLGGKHHTVAKEIIQLIPNT